VKKAGHTLISELAVEPMRLALGDTYETQLDLPQMSS